MKSCFGYVRVSTAKQGEGVSLEAQREAIERFSAKNNIAISQWFQEKKTAAKSGRPIFNGMITALRRGKASGVVMHKIDRSARNFRDWAKIGELADSGIDIHFATETLDFRSRGGRLSADIQAVIAADYIRNLREETIKGLNGRLKQGLYPFKAPIGYLDNGGGKAKTPDPVRGPMIVQAFELYGSGRHSLRSIRAELNNIGLRNDHGKPLSKHGVEAILNNPFHCGVIRIRRTGAVYQGIHEPLVSVALFERVQDIKANKAGKKVTRHNHTYRGLFRCGHCKGPMIPERQKGTVYYRCQVQDCPTKCIREEALETAIQEVLDRVRLSDDDVKRLMTDITAWIDRQSTSDKIKPIKLQLSQLKDRLDRLTDALIDSLIDKETFNQRKERLLLDKAGLEEQVENVAKQTPNPSLVRKFLERLKSLAETYKMANPAEKRELAENSTSNRCVVGKNIYLEPANWLIAVENALAVLSGDPERPTSRTKNREVARLIETINNLEPEKFENLGSIESYFDGGQID